MHAANWLMWAAVLFFQNISFTYVSRARSSGSLPRHLKASIFSNGIWIFSNMLMLGPMFAYLTGKHGIPSQVLSGIVYTVACVSGSLFAHYLAMKTEKGKNAVGFNKKYAQIPVEEWDAMKRYAPITASDWELFTARVNAAGADLEQLKQLPTKEEFAQVRSLAAQAFDISFGAIPDSGISAQKFGKEIVTTGLPSKS